MKSAHQHASGKAIDNFVPGEFQHPASHAHYRVFEENGSVWLSFGKDGDSLVQGKRQLLYYIGQGRRGTTYLFATDGYYFETPINLYTNRHLWDMAPAYGRAHEIPMNLPALPSCMDCHASGIRPPIEGTENRYAAPLFAAGGVTCERCHGPSAAHAKDGTASIVNPAKLTAARRDEVCMQCHLEGNAAIERPGKHLYEYKAGDDLFDYVRYYILIDPQKPGLRAASQFEQLAVSKCKKKTGDAMSCTSCHDPHRTIPAEERVAYYRSKCLACHGTNFGETHHASQPDCTQCHMPALSSKDIAHTAVTDHSIPRRPASTQEPPPSTRTAELPQLEPFPKSVGDKDNDVRDLALAWQSIVNSGMTAAEPQAKKLLEHAKAEFPNDATVLAALGFDDQKDGEKSKAGELYRKALSLDPGLVDVETNLGVLEAQSGDLQDAIRLWKDAFRRAPGNSEIGIDLAKALCAEGRTDDARNSTLRVLQFNPDSSAAKALLKQLNSERPGCGG